MSDTQPSTQQEQLELFLARRQAHQGRSSLLIKCAEAWHWAALSIPFIYTVAVLRHVLHCDVIHHTLSHITARRLITHRSAKFKRSSNPQWATHMHRCLVRHECLRLLVLARHGSLQKVRTEHTSEFVTHSISSRNNFEAWHSAKLTAEAAWWILEPSQAHQGRNSLSISCAEAWHWIARSNTLDLHCNSVMTCITLWYCDTSHTVTHYSQARIYT